MAGFLKITDLFLGVLRVSTTLGFTKIKGTFLRVPIIRIVEFGVCIRAPVFREATIVDI